MCDGLTNMDDVAALAALAQCLVAWSIEQVDAGRALPGAPEWVVRENKWLASRHGLDTSFIVDRSGRRTDADRTAAGTRRTARGDRPATGLRIRTGAGA